MEREKPTIVEACQSKDFFRTIFKDLKTWQAWITFLKALYSLPMEPEDYELYQRCTQRKIVSKGGFKESYAIVGRRGGKSQISALIAVYTALFGGFERYLAPGERAWVFCIATDKTQAKIVLDYIRGILELFPDIVEKELVTEIRLKNRINISVKPSNYKAGRGFSTCLICLDELAFYRTETSANPAEEIIASLLPGLLPNGLLIGISTPYGKFGYLYSIYKENFGNEDSDILVWKASTRTMNPTYSQSIIDRLFKRDRTAMKAEYLAEFREDITAFLTEELVEKAIDQNLIFNYPEPVRYKAFCDPSGGRQDSFTMAIGHTENEFVVIDRVEELKPPFDPSNIVKEYASILREYKIHQIFGDRFSAEWCAGAWRKEGINYIASELDKSSIYINAQPLFSMQKIRLPNNERLKAQLLSLERKTRSGGKDLVDHPQGMHDDICNSALGCAVALFKDISKYRKLTPEELRARLPQKAYRSEKDRMGDEAWRKILQKAEAEMAKAMKANPRPESMMGAIYRKDGSIELKSGRVIKPKPEGEDFDYEEIVTKKYDKIWEKKKMEER